MTLDIPSPGPPVNTPVMLLNEQDNMAPMRPSPTPASTPRLHKDFAVSAFSKPEDMEKLVRALAQHDAQQSLFEITQFAFFPALSPGFISLRPIAFAPGERVQIAESLRAYITTPGDEVTESGSSSERDDPGSGSSTEREDAELVGTYSATLSKTLLGRAEMTREGEHGLDAAPPAKKGKKKKNKKKKGKAKAKGSNEEVLEVEEASGKLAMGEGESTLDNDLDAKELEEIEVELGTPLVSGSGNSGNTPSNGLSIIVTPETPPIDPVPGQIASFSPINTPVAMFKAATEGDRTDLDPAETAPDQPVLVDLPAQEGNTKANDQERKTEVTAGTGATTQIKLPLTPPQSPRLASPEPSIMINEVIHLGFDEPFASPQPLKDITSPSPCQAPGDMPLSRSWTLHHSNTGTGAATATHSARLVIANIPGLPVPPIVPVPTRSKAEEYSHGLFPLFTASNVVDLLGTWKALRRKIALSRGRPIEAEGQPIQAGTAGLGIFYLPEDTNFHFSVASIKPMWEDPLCGKGGKFMLTGNPGQVSSFLRIRDSH